MKALREILIDLQKNLKEQGIAQHRDVLVEFWTKDGAEISQGEGVKVSFTLNPSDTRPASDAAPEEHKPAKALDDRANWASFQQDK